MAHSTLPLVWKFSYSPYLYKPTYSGSLVLEDYNTLPAGDFLKWKPSIKEYMPGSPKPVKFVPVHPKNLPNGRIFYISRRSIQTIA